VANIALGGAEAEVVGQGDEEEGTLRVDIIVHGEGGLADSVGASGNASALSGEVPGGLGAGNSGNGGGNDGGGELHCGGVMGSEGDRGG